MTQYRSLGELTDAVEGLPHERKIKIVVREFNECKKGVFDDKHPKLLAELYYSQLNRLSWFARTQMKPSGIEYDEAECYHRLFKDCDQCPEALPMIESWLEGFDQ